MAINNLPGREEYLRKRRKRRLIRVGLVVFILVSIVSLLSFISHRSKIRITRVELTGGILVTQEEVQSKALDFMSGSYFWLFPKNNSFIYPKGELEKYLKQTFQRIDTIEIHLQGFKTLVVNIKEREPYAMWCDTLPPSDSEHCYFLDQNGTIFAEAPQFSGDAYFKYYGLVTDVNPIGMQYIASSSQFYGVSSFVDTVKNLSLKPQYLIANEKGQYTIVLGSGTKIYFDMEESLVKTSDNLKALLKTPALANLSAQNLPIDYIDLRFGNKLFYKLK
jgi:hypothetical protein